MNEILSYQKPAGQWRGYNMRELQMRRTLVQARMEIQKYKLAAATENVRGAFAGIDAGSLGTKVSGWLSYAEYAVDAFKIVRKIFTMFRRRR